MEAERQMISSFCRKLNVVKVSERAAQFYTQLMSASAGRTLHPSLQHPQVTNSLYYITSFGFLIHGFTSKIVSYWHPAWRFRSRINKSNHCRAASWLTKYIVGVSWLLWSNNQYQNLV